jgi:hypothetical protein
VKTALVVLLVCAAIDLAACAALLAVVWVEHRRQLRRAAEAGESLPSAAGQFGCLIALGAAGFVVLYGAAWLLIGE